MTDRIIFIDDDDDLRAAQVQGLELAGFTVHAFANGPDALKTITADFEGVVVTDVRMPVMDGLEVFARLRALDPSLPVILLTGHGDVPMAVAALKDGAYDFITKPFAMDMLTAALRRALTTRHLALENRRIRALFDAQAEGTNRLLGDSAAIRQLRQVVAQVAAAEVDLLIEGETGVGKELVARTIHRQSARKSKPFIEVNGSAMPDAVFAAELFGVESGARLDPHGAVSRRTLGRIEKAQKGTLYLDDIDALSPSLQSQLLRVVEARQLWVLGAEEPRPVDIRIIASTRVDLADAVRKGHFRADLYYRLSGITLKIPPLRERHGDVTLLFQHFVADACVRLKRPIPQLSADVANFLQRHDWPGNVRELEQYAERYALGLALTVLPEGSESGAGASGLVDRVRDFEAALIRETLSACQGDVQTALDMLQLPRKTFYDKLHRHGISIDGFRRSTPS